MSGSTSSTRNVKLGVCRVTFGGADLGLTKGGVEFNVTTETHKVTVDQYGSTPISELVMGREAKVSVPMAETTLENLVAIMPGATLVTDATDPTKKHVNVPTGVGTNLLDLAKTIVLHPIGKAENDKSDDLTLFKAGTPGALQFAYKVDEERIFSCEFTAYPDEKGNLFALGDTTATAAP